MRQSRRRRSQEGFFFFSRLGGWGVTHTHTHKETFLAGSYTALLNHSWSVQREGKFCSYQGSMAIKSCNDINRRTRRGRDKRVVHEEVKKGRFTEKGFFFSPPPLPFRCAERAEAHFIRAAAEVEEKGGREQEGREQRKKGRMRARVREGPRPHERGRVWNGTSTGSHTLAPNSAGARALQVMMKMDNIKAPGAWRRRLKGRISALKSGAQRWENAEQSREEEVEEEKKRERLTGAVNPDKNALKIQACGTKRKRKRLIAFFHFSA